MRKTYTISEVKQAIADVIERDGPELATDLLLEALSHCPQDAVADIYNDVCNPKIESSAGGSKLYRTKLPHWPQVAQEFPDWNIGDIEIPKSWVEESWRNDVCPSWSVPKTNLKVWVDYINPDERECSCARFGVSSENDKGEFTTLIETDAWWRILELVKVYETNERTMTTVVVVADLQTCSSSTHATVIRAANIASTEVAIGRLRESLKTRQYIIKVTPVQ